MCGIVGAVAEREVVAILLEGLRRLEYRGYDSAGLATLLPEQDCVQRRRALGKVAELEHTIKADPIHGHIGIAHTRWATHGVPSERNAHPHTSGNQLAVVHNGIIENYEALREELRVSGYVFSSETDTEVIVHLIEKEWQQCKDLLIAVQRAVLRLEGAYALGVIHASQPNRLIAAREGSPLVIGLGIGENFIASDQLALFPVTNRFQFLEEGDIAVIKKDEIEIFNRQNTKVQRQIHEFDGAHELAEKGEYRHFMLKEIYEQSRAIQATLDQRVLGQEISLAMFPEACQTVFKQIERVQIVACGTSYHAGCVARYWFEQLTSLPCQIEVASEFRYRKKNVQANTLFITVSQSGETADTLAALRSAKQLGYLCTLAICNSPTSSLIRESDYCLLTYAGPEIGVASTKAFTTQLCAFLLLILFLGKIRGDLNGDEKSIVAELRCLPVLIEKTLLMDSQIQQLAEEFRDKHHALFLGRGSQFPIALEGALKLKEISYIHAEAYPAGELKHGPLALVDSDMPIIAVAPNNELHEKLKSNLEEVKARGGELYIFADKALNLKGGPGQRVLELPHVSDLLAPIIYTLPLQLLAYHVAVIRGTDVDQPRNLAKSVTVE
jgi:glucosamine--fructose-6-phosphate aminotransferase (isomerizing)